MKNWKFLSGVIFLIGVFVLVGLIGKAHAGLAWKGFSSLCYTATLKGVPDQELRINVVNLEIQAGCLNEMDNSIDCKSGQGNSGSFVIEEFAGNNANSDKEKGTVTIEGCIDLDKYTNHYVGDTIELTPRCGGGVITNCHEHICYPFNNIHKVEVEGAAYVSSIDVTYDVINLKNNKYLYSAHQTCTWPGNIDQTTCIPEHGIEFVCQEEEIINQ